MCTSVSELSRYARYADAPSGEIFKNEKTTSVMGSRLVAYLQRKGYADDAVVKSSTLL